MGKTRVKKVAWGQVSDRLSTGMMVIYGPQGSYIGSCSQFGKVDEVLALSQIEYYKNRQLYFEPDFLIQIDLYWSRTNGLKRFVSH